MAQRTTSHSPSRRAHRWAAARYLGDLWAQLLRDARALNAEAWRRWVQATLAGLVLTSALAAGLTLLARWAAPRGLQAWDEAMLPRIIAWAPLDFAAAGMVETPGNLFGMALLVGAGVLLAIRAGKPLIVASLLSIYWLGTAVLWAGWLPWGRERPDVVAGGLAAPGLHSFPSGHILHVVAVYGFLAYLWCRATGSWAERILAVGLCAALCVAVALARLALGAHWPSDILAGALIGLVWLAVGVVALRRAEAAPAP
jgi:membrane-associated phospholipid phosphatase